MGHMWCFCSDSHLLLLTYSIGSCNYESDKLIHRAYTLSDPPSLHFLHSVHSMDHPLGIPRCLHHVSRNDWTTSRPTRVCNHSSMDLTNKVHLPLSSIRWPMGQCLPRWMLPVHYRSCMRYMVLLSYK